MPKQIVSTKDGGLGVFEGSFNGDVALTKNYLYFALGNPQLMDLLYYSSKPVFSILKHDSRKGILLVYKITVFDGKGRERNGKIIAFNMDSDTHSIEEVPIHELWSCQSPAQIIHNYDKFNLLEKKEIADSYLNKDVKFMLDETQSQLTEIKSKTEDSLIRYYSKQIEEMYTKISDYTRHIEENPTFSKKIKNERSNIQLLKNELNLKLSETKKNFSLYHSVEMIGFALLENEIAETIPKYIERPFMVPRLNEFSKQNQLINSENSETTHERLNRNPSEWADYHKRFEEIRKLWVIDPLERIIMRLSKLSPRLRIGDFGCGKAKIEQVFGREREVKSFDHVSIKSQVTSCNIKSIPIENGYLDIIVFSLSLMGHDWVDYISEANRCLMSKGLLIISDTIRALNEGRLINLREILVQNNFEIYKEEQLDIFFYLEARKM